VDGGSDTGNAIDGGSDNDDIGSGYYSISMSIFALFIISLVRFQWFYEILQTTYFWIFDYFEKMKFCYFVILKK